MNGVYYFDYAATTPVSAYVAGRMSDVMIHGYGNPSSQHPYGQAALREMETDRETIANALGCDSKYLIFTSGGTESNNWAIFGALNMMRHGGGHMVTTAMEHSAVMETCSYWNEKGWDVTYVTPNGQGEITAQQVADATREDTALVSVMSVNNETGNTYDIAGMIKAVREKGSRAVFHTDHVQGFLKIPFSVRNIGVDLVSVNAHKIGGPKGVGALYISPRIWGKMQPVFWGGGQERGLRSGTEATGQIAGFAAAVAQRQEALAHINAHTAQMRDYAMERLLTIPTVKVVGTPNAPHILCLTLPGYPAQNIVNDLGSRGIYLSTGSACHKGKVSHVMRALGLSRKDAVGSFRISFGERTTKESIDVLCDAISQHHAMRFPIL